MSEDRLDAVENRLAVMGRRLDSMDNRLRLLENLRSTEAREEWQASTPTPPPQPTRTPEPPPVIPRHWQTAPPSAGPRSMTAPPAATQAPSPGQRWNEYNIGAKLLPKFGAGLVLLGVLYFVGWGYSSGWITPWMVFWGELLFCAAFITIGQWQRNQREQYGQILTGIGSCGLYLSFAGGHLVQNLFAGEVLVTAFMALSFGNLLYGLWSKSRAFLSIGIIGGLSAALLPMKEQKVTLDGILHLAIVLPAALIAMRRRWNDMAAWLWLASTAALVPVLVSAAPWQFKVGVLYGASLISIAAYVTTYKKSAFDDGAILAPMMLAVTGLIGFAVEHQPAGAVHLLLLGAVGSLVGVGAAESGVPRNNLVATSLGVPLALGPFCFSRIECLWLFIGISVAAGIASALPRSKAAAGYACLEFALGVASYLAIQSWKPLRTQEEAWILGGIIAAAITTAWAAVRVGGAAEVFSLVAMAIVAPLVGRLGIVTLTSQTSSISAEFAAAEALAFFAICAIAFAARTRWMSAVVAMWVAFGLAAFAYLNAVSFAPPTGVAETGLLVALGLIVAVGVPVAGSTSPPDFRKSIVACSGTLVGAVVMRLAYVVASIKGVEIDRTTAVIVAGAAYSLIFSVVAAVRKGEAATVVAWATLVFSGSMYATAQGIPLGLEMLAISSLLVAFVGASIAVRPSARQTPEIWHAVAVLGWIAFTRWVDVGMSWSGGNLHGLSTVTVAWIVYALTLLSVGFAAAIRELRYWNFAVMFATVCKILALDLASTTIPFRVAVLLGLGLLMLGGGYWYIKGRSTTATT